MISFFVFSAPKIIVLFVLITQCAAVGFTVEPKVLALLQGHCPWRFPYLEGDVQGFLDGVPIIKGFCGTPRTSPWVSNLERRGLLASGTGSEPWPEADGQPRPAKRARAAVQRGESAPAQARRGGGRGLTRDDTGWEAQLAN
jgi:hypothetical protein